MENEDDEQIEKNKINKKNILKRYRVSVDRGFSDFQQVITTLKNFNFRRTFTWKNLLAI